MVEVEIGFFRQAIGVLGACQHRLAVFRDRRRLLPLVPRTEGIHRFVLFLLLGEECGSFSLPLRHCPLVSRVYISQFPIVRR